MFFFWDFRKKTIYLYIYISAYCVIIICILWVYTYIFIIFFTPNIYNIYYIYIIYGVWKKNIYVYIHTHIYIYEDKNYEFFAFQKRKFQKNKNGHLSDLVLGGFLLHYHPRTWSHKKVACLISKNLKWFKPTVRSNDIDTLSKTPKIFLKR